MVTVGECAEVAVDIGDEVVEHDFIERIAVGAHTLTVVTTAERSLDIAALHDDNHGNSLARGNQVVHDVLHAALLAPTRLILAHTVLQVEHRILLLALLVFCGRIDHGMAPFVAGVGIVVDAAHLSVGNALLRTVVIAFATLGNLNAACFAVAAEEGLGGGVDEVDTIDIHEIVVEARHKRVGDSHEVAFAIGLHVIFLAADVDNDLTGIGGCNAEIGTAFLVNLRELIARNGGLGNEGICGNLNLFRHVNMGTLGLIA